MDSLYGPFLCPKCGTTAVIWNMHFKAYMCGCDYFNKELTPDNIKQLRDQFNQLLAQDKLHVLDSLVMQTYYSIIKAQESRAKASTLVATSQP